MEQTNTLICPNCGAVLHYNNELEFITCTYCGTTSSISEILHESDIIKQERIKSKMYHDMEVEKRRTEKENLNNKKEETKRHEKEQRIEKFKKSKYSKILIIFLIIFILFCCVSFNDGKIVNGFISLIQAILCLLLWLTGNEMISLPKPYLKPIFIIMIIMLFIPFNLNLSETSSVSEIQYIKSDDLYLSDTIPKLPKKWGQIIIDTTDSLYLQIPRVNKGKYKKYLEECQEEGFKKETVYDGESFEAFNDEGYHLKLNFYDYQKMLVIDLSAPIQMGELIWPSGKAGKMVPKPKSKFGKIEWEHDDSFCMYIGDMSKQAYEEYISKISEKGFNKKYKKGENFYRANNKEKYHINIEYQGNNVVFIRLDTP